MDTLLWGAHFRQRFALIYRRGRPGVTVSACALVRLSRLGVIYSVCGVVLSRLWGLHRVLSCRYHVLSRLLSCPVTSFVVSCLVFCRVLSFVVFVSCALLFSCPVSSTSRLSRDELYCDERWRLRPQRGKPYHGSIIRSTCFHYRGVACYVQPYVVVVLASA